MPDIITDDGVRLHYVIDDYRESWLGEPSATVLLHHGFLKTLEHWTPFVASVARRYRVVRFDVRGAGKSSAPPEGSVWTTERLVKDALNLIDALGIKQVHWAGFESGAVVGLLFAASHPERAQSLACFNMPYRDAASKSTMGDIFCCGYASPDEAIDKLGLTAWIAHLCAQGVLIDRDDPAVVHWVAAQAANVTPTVAKEWHRVFWKTSDILASLPAQITVPVLLLAGANHRHGCEPPLLDRLRQKLQNAREVVYIPGVAIGVHLLAADACAAAYLRFLDGVDGP